MRIGIFALLSTLAVAGCDDDGLPELGNTVLVVIGDANQTPADQALNSRLVGLEHDTRVIDEPSLTTEELTDDVGFVVISSSVRSSAPFDSISDTPRPVVIAQVWVADDFGVTASDAKIRELNVATAGPDDDLGSWNVVDADHPAAGETSAGPLAMWTVEQTTVTPMVDVVGSPAKVVAEFAPDLATLLVYDRGDELASGEAAAQKRVLVAFAPDSPVRLTDQGWTLFDSAIRWAFD